MVSQRIEAMGEFRVSITEQMDDNKKSHISICAFYSPGL